MTFIPPRTINIQRGASLTKCSDVSAHLGVITSLWTQMDATLTEIFGLLAGVDAEIAMKLYTAIDNEGARKAVFMKLAEERLSDSLNNDLVTIFKKIRRTGESRNIVAHGFWGSSPEITDAIFYTDPRVWLNWQSQIHSAARKGETNKARQIALKWPDAIGYRQDDFEKIEKKIMEIIGLIENFRHSLVRQLSMKR